MFIDEYQREIAKYMGYNGKQLEEIKDLENENYRLYNSSLLDQIYEVSRGLENIKTMYINMDDIDSKEIENYLEDTLTYVSLMCSALNIDLNHLALNTISPK